MSNVYTLGNELRLVGKDVWERVSDGKRYRVSSNDDKRLFAEGRLSGKTLIAYDPKAAVFSPIMLVDANV